MLLCGENRVSARIGHGGWVTHLDTMRLVMPLDDKTCGWTRNKSIFLIVFRLWSKRTRWKGTCHCPSRRPWRVHAPFQPSSGWFFSNARAIRFARLSSNHWATTRHHARRHHERQVDVRVQWIVWRSCDLLDLWSRYLHPLTQFEVFVWCQCD